MFNRKKSDKIIDLTVYEFFSGKVKLLKKRRKRIYVEIVDVYMCYPCESTLPAGERLWVAKEDICRPQSKIRETLGVTYFRAQRFLRNIFAKKEDTWENDLPF